MARERDPNRDKAYEIWKQHDGNITNREIAHLLSTDEKKIAVWKQRDKWNVVQQKRKNVVQQKRNTTKKARSPSKKAAEEPVVETDELTEKQRLFCLYYVKTFNATQSAIKAGYASESAHVEGSRLLRNAKVSAEIKRIKSDMTHDLFLDAMDVLQKWVKIAFSDITDYLTFGQKEVPVIGMMGPVQDEEGNQVMQTVNYVDFKESGFVDGTIISEVKQGKDGVSIKLEDRMKALEKLSLYFDLFPDKFKRKIEEEKLKIAHHKVFGGDDPEEYEDDGFLEALDGKEVNWDEDS